MPCPDSVDGRRFAHDIVHFEFRMRAFPEYCKEWTKAQDTLLHADVGSLFKGNFLLEPGVWGE